MTLQHSKGNDFVIDNFLGLNESENDFAVEGGVVKPNECRRLEELRPDGGRLILAPGNQVHSTFAWKGADRPCTLIRWAKEDGTAYWVMTAWDNVFVLDGADWVALLKPDLYDGWYPSNLLYYLNSRFDHAVYKDALYLTDGRNRPMKFNGNLIGMMGLQALTGVLVLEAKDEFAMAGALVDNRVYHYFATLYDDINLLEGNISTNYIDHTIGDDDANNHDVWIHLLHNADLPWLATGNYEYHNEFARYIRIYRSPADGAEAPANAPGDYATDPRYLVGAFRAGLLAKGTIDTLTDNGGATGTLVDADGRFLSDNPLDSDEKEVGDPAINATSPSIPVCYIVHGAGYTAYQVNVVENGLELTLLDADGAAFTIGANFAGDEYFIFGGILDETGDLVTPGVQPMYFGDENDTNDVKDHSPPPYGAAIAIFGDRNNRAHITADPSYPSRAYYSSLGFPDYFPLGNWNDLDPDDSDILVAVIKFQGKLLYFKRRSVIVGNVDGDPATWAWVPRALSVGASHRRTIVDCAGMLIFANEGGVYAYDGQKLNLISDRAEGSNIKQTWEKVVKAEMVRAEAVFHVERKELWVSVCLDDARGLFGERPPPGDINEGGSGS